VVAEKSFVNVMDRAKLEVLRPSTVAVKSTVDENSEKYQFAPDESEFKDEIATEGRQSTIPRYGPISDIQRNQDPEEESEYKFEGPKRCGTVAIVGAPNAGKSTLMNHMVGSKVAIVTHKRQTTRNSVTGIGMEGGTQVIYIDTPGIMSPRPKERLNKAMVKSAWNSARDADEVALPPSAI
jgi:GTP-binding protein Era